VEESKLEESESKNAQGLLTSAVFNILLVLIETCQGVSLIALMLWALLEVGKSGWMLSREELG